MATALAKRKSQGSESAAASSYALGILERFATTASHNEADRQFYAACVWKIAEGSITETEQSAFDLLVGSSPGSFDFAGDLDTVKKILDWRRSGNLLADSTGFGEKVQQLQDVATQLAADHERSKQNTAKLAVDHAAAVASLKKYENRGRQWADFMKQRPHLFGEGVQ